MALESDCSLFLGTEVQIVVFCTTIETQVVFEIFLALVTSQLAITSQFGRKVYLQRIGLFFRSRRWR